MATREIKTRFRLEGENEYRRAMKEAADATKVLNSEQKLAEAQYEATGDAQQYVTSTTEILSNKIKEQEKVADAAQKAIEKLRELGVSDADKLMQDWKIKLNTAKTNLTKYQNDLNSLTVDIQPEKDLAGQLDTIANKIDFQNTINAIENIQGKIETVIKTAARAAVAVWNMEADAGKWADDLATAASKAGLSVEAYQAWNYASQFIDTDVSKITSTITKLEKDLGSEDKEIAKAFNQLGVSTRQASGQVKNATVVFWDVIDALGRIEDPTRRSILAQKLLGQSWKDLNPLIESGSKAYYALVQEGLETAVVSEENVKKLGDMNDAQNKLNASIQKAKFDTLASLAPTFTEVSNALSTAVGALNEFLQSQEGQEALGKLNEALTGVIESFLGEDGGKGTFKSIVEGASEAIKIFNDLLGWISEHGETVKDIVVALVGAWGVLEISSTVLHFLQLLQAIPLEKLTAAFGGSAAKAAAGASSAAGAAGTAAAGAAAAAKTAPAGVPANGPTTLVGTATNPLMNALSLGALLKTGIDYAKETGSGLVGELYKKQNPDLNPIKVAGFMDENGNVISEEQIAKMAEKSAAAAEETVEKTIATKISSANWEELFKKDPENDIWKQIFGDFDLEWVKQNWQQAAPYMLDAILKETQNKDYFIELGQESADATATGIESEKGRFNVAGENAAVGFANGLMARVQDVYDAGKALAQTAQDAMKTDLDIASPSKVMARLGGFTAQGFAEGIDRGMSDVERAVSRMAGAAFRAPVIAAPQMSRIAQAAPGVPGSQAADAGTAGQNIQAVIMMDKRVVGYMVAPAVNEAIGAIVEEMRA